MVARVLAGRVASSLDAVLAVKDELMDRELVLKGKFADEIARLEKAKADAEEKLGMIETVEQAGKVLADAQAEAQKLKSDSAFKYDEAQGVLASALARQKAVEEKELSVAAREAKCVEIESRFDSLAKALVKREDALKAAQEAGKTALDTRAAALAKYAGELSDKAESLTSRERRFNQRLEGLKLPAE